MPEQTVMEEQRDGERFLPVGFFEFFPDLVRDRARFGPLLRRTETPLFLADTAILVDRYLRLQRALESCWGNWAIAYSFKTNYAVAESRVLQQKGAWAEVVSGREYKLAKRLGYAGEQIVFNGPYKRDDELRQALRDGALIHVNDGEELTRLLALLPPRPTAARIGLRVSVDSAGAGWSRFGLSLERGEAAAAVARIVSVPGLALAGFHLHLKGDTDDPTYYREAARRLASLVAHASAGEVPQRIRSLDLGGGFPAHGPKPRSRQGWNPRPIDEYVAAISEELARVCGETDQPTLILEPGRYLVADAIVFICEVVFVAREGEFQLVRGNGAVTMVPLTHYCPQVVRVFAPDLTPRGSAGDRTIVFGASCRENDILYKGLLPPTRVGDYLVFYAAGAYNSTLSPDFIFDSPPVLFA